MQLASECFIFSLQFHDFGLQNHVVDPPLFAGPSGRHVISSKRNKSFNVMVMLDAVIVDKVLPPAPVPVVLIFSAFRRELSLSSLVKQHQLWGFIDHVTLH